jgi:hypothetical protein
MRFKQKHFTVTTIKRESRDTLRSARKDFWSLESQVESDNKRKIYIKRRVEGREEIYVVFNEPGARMRRAEETEMHSHWARDLNASHLRFTHSRLVYGKHQWAMLILNKMSARSFILVC